LKRHVHISVKALVEHLYRRGDLSFAFGQSPRLSGLQGLRIHQEIQKSRPGSYKGEVGVSYRTEGTNIILDIQGRIDGIYKQEKNTIIEEIKTTQKDLDPFIDENSDLHWAQAKIYAAIFAEQDRLEEISIQLTYCQVSTGIIKNLVQKFRVDDLAIFLHFSLQNYMEWLERLENERLERNLHISQSNFPYRSFRKGQIEMILDVQEAIKHKEQLIIQAPTGIGKTVAALYPSIKALAEDHTGKIFYLTARSTGRTIAEKTLSELHAKGLKIKSITLTAKEKICFNPEKNCTGEECDFARGYYDRLAEARGAIFRYDIWTIDEIRSLALDHKLCPFELSLDLSLWVDCVICDLNYAFDPRVYLRRYFLGNPTAYTFLVDEAHNLVDRSRDMYSAEITRASFLKLRRTLRDKNSAMYRMTQDIVTAMKKMEEELEPDYPFLWEKDKPDQLLPQLKSFCLELERWIVSHPQSPQYQNWIELFFTTNWFLNVAELYNDNYSTRLQREGHNLSLKLFCIDPSDQLKETLERAKSAVLFSATITPISYFAQMLGCRESITKRILPSPFPSNNLCLCISNNISTFYKNREDTKDSVCRAVGTFIDSKKGNYLVFFPSYEYMHMVHPIYISNYPHHKTLVQKPGMTENEKLDFLENFAFENNRPLAGFVVMGGIFGEGIDLSGDRLSGAVIVGVGLPGISPERELIKHHFTAQNEPGFNYAYLFPGMNRVFQAAGRVIRSEKDKGAVLLIDSRYMRPEYSSLFPGEWQIRRITCNAHMKRTLDRFWNHGRP
jgi:DNA excision repair protein ERCC-2